MIRSKLAMAAFAALTLALTGCPDDNNDGDNKPKVCDPACLPNQNCDTTQNPPVCVNKPVPQCEPACGEGFVCNTDRNPPECKQVACVPACPEHQKCDTLTWKCVDREACDPGCPAGTVCDPSLNECVCDPACRSGQRCDKTQVPAVCKEICNPPAGCLAGWEVCNEETEQCEPLSCGSNKCEFGQGCFNPNTMNPGGTTCTCLPARPKDPTARPDTCESVEMLPDTCEVYGMVCDYNEDAPAASKCKLPGVYDSCLPSIGCEEGLDCVDDGRGGTCMQPCETTENCGDIADLCWPDDGSPNANHCITNFCAIPFNYGAEERDLYFQPCPTLMAGETADPSTWTGTCVPLSLCYNSQLTDVGLCFQAGTAPSHGQCDPDADRSNLEEMCPVNQLCTGVMPSETEGKQVGICIELCNAGKAPRPAVGCGAAPEAMDYCMDVSGVDYDNPAWQHEARIGFCLEGCNPFTDEPCSNDILGNEQGCWLGPSLDEKGYCNAVIPDAPGVGEACTPIPANSLDDRSECGDRLICLAMDSYGINNRCMGWCSHHQCNFLDDCMGCVGTFCEACAPNCTAGSCGGSDGCGGTCGCGEGQVCNAGTCCTPTCTEGECGGDDGCGGTCGCPDGQACNTESSTCEACTPSCEEGSCGGDDGCGGTCGCDEGHVCTAGTCCKPSCDGINCINFEALETAQSLDDLFYPDGCGGFCGCPEGKVCGNTGKCHDCVPDCRFKTCGDDGCGGSCGDCGANEICKSVSTGQQCLFLDEADAETSPLGVCVPD
ncbi:MAG: hypothetical protein ACOX6T_13350 [Myxococcales bacterium]|jgi:hypothetical protein